MRKEMTQTEMNAIFISTLEGIKSVCEKTTSGNVSHNIAAIKCKCTDMLQFFDRWNKHIPSATDDVLSRIPELQWKKHSFGLLACIDLCNYYIDVFPNGKFRLYTLYGEELNETFANIADAKKCAYEHYKEQMRKILGI